MNAGVKLIKRNRAALVQSSRLDQDEKPVRDSEREIAGTVKNWIAELTQRKRADEQIAAQIFAGLQSRAFNQHALQ